MVLRVGVVGCGNIAGNHVSAFRGASDLEVAVCCDVDAQRADRFAARHSIAASVADVDALFDLGVHIVSVCTPHPPTRRWRRPRPRAAHTCCARSRSRPTWGRLPG